jgi:hypothetical protein
MAIIPHITTRIQVLAVYSFQPTLQGIGIINPLYILLTKYGSGKWSMKVVLVCGFLVPLRLSVSAVTGITLSSLKAI